MTDWYNRTMEDAIYDRYMESYFDRHRDYDLEVKNNFKEDVKNYLNNNGNKIPKKKIE